MTYTEAQIEAAALVTDLLEAAEDATGYLNALPHWHLESSESDWDRRVLDLFRRSIAALAAAEEAGPRDLSAYPFDNLRDSGLLWLINRVVFHPRGFALALVKNGDAVLGWELLGNGSEVWTFEDEDEHFRAVEDFFRARRLPVEGGEG